MLIGKNKKTDIRNNSFALPRPDTNARWFDQGRDYYWYLAEMILKAKEEIFITDWWLWPEGELKRPKEKYNSRSWRLEDMLLAKAEEGVTLTRFCAV